MAGHSKWAQIKRTKAKVDAERGRLFSRLAKDIMTAARNGGPNPEANLRLKVAIERAREANMPNENIQRAILKGSGQLPGAKFEEVVYEGYGPGGVAIMMEALTDNRNRTAADIRAIFNKCGGSLGESGSVSWMFQKKGIITVSRAENNISEDDLLAIVLEAGAEDMQTSPEVFEITTAPEDLDKVLQALQAQGVKVEEGKVALIPSTTVEVTGETAQKVLRLMEMLEENDDVQNVYANFEIPDSELAAMER
ncbi:MAG: YebC/PmpR family DNA-binding transcriptional regulator [Firmicutes bacterium]|nr:YebC/PmpR family DNA-binding transcriptional regulator [Bacillota bacterium]